MQEGPGRAAAAELGHNAAFVRCDVTSEAEVNAAMETAQTHMGGINLLVNCAGVIGAGRVLGKNGPMAGDFFTKVMHINLIGTFLCDKAAAALMQHNPPSEDGERGLLIHTSSVAAFEGQIGQAAYSATKAGLAGMTLPIARELARFGIRCVSIAPGIFHTPMMDGMSAGGAGLPRQPGPLPRAPRQAGRVRAPGRRRVRDPDVERRDHPPRRRRSACSRSDELANRRAKRRSNVTSWSMTSSSSAPARRGSRAPSA